MEAMIKIPEYFDSVTEPAILKMDGMSCVEYHEFTSQHRHHAELTRHLLAVVIAGKKIIHTDSGDVQVLAGEAFFAEKGFYLLSEIVSPDCSYRSLIFFLEDDFIVGLTNRYPEIFAKAESIPQGPSLSPIPVSPLTKAEIESIFPHFVFSSNQQQSILRLKLEEIVLTVATHSDSKQFVSLLSRISRQSTSPVANVVSTNFTKRMTLDELAKLSGRSRTAFKEEFQKIYKMPPKQWINQKRLQTARFMLSVPGASVTDVAMDVGFDSVSHFVQLFRKTYTQTPGQYQKDLDRQKEAQSR